MRDFIERIEKDLPATTAPGGAGGPTFGEEAGMGPRRARGVVVVADMEAGLEHLSWAGGTLRYVDLLLVVVQPTAKVMMTADRTHKLALELGIERIAFVGNRATSEADVDRMAAFAAERDCELLIAIPEDGAVPAADRASRCVLDTAPDSEAVRAIGRLADRLEAQFVPAG